MRKLTHHDHYLWCRCVSPVRIPQVLRFMKQLLGINIVLGAILSGLLWIPSAGWAGSNLVDDPPPNTNNRSGGSRGCGTTTAATSDLPALILLAPSQLVGKTAATRPTLAWFVTDPGAWKMEFRLYEYDPVSEEAKLIQEIKDEGFRSAPGIVVLSLSKSMPKLSIGHRYLWQVELNCNLNNPSGNPFAEAELKVVEAQPDLATELAIAKNSNERAALYAQAGLWYDALATALKASTAEDELNMQQLRASLLEKVALTEEETQKLSTSSVTQVQR